MAGTNVQSGFTLIELLMAVVVLAILLAIAVPSFRTIIEDNRRTTTVNSLLSALQLARAEAVKRSEEVVICHSSAGTACDGTWNNGWIVFTDLDNDATMDNSGDCAVGNECLLRVAGDVESGITIANAPDDLIYLPSGLLDDNNDQSFDITIDDCTGQRARQINISVTGRPSVEEKACP